MRRPQAHRIGSPFEAPLSWRETIGWLIAWALVLLIVVLILLGT